MGNMNRIDKERGNRIRFIRKTVLRLTSAGALADLLTSQGFKVTRGGVSNWEQGQNIGIEAMRTLAQVSGLDLNWISHAGGTAPAGWDGKKQDGAPEGDAREEHSPAGIITDKRQIRDFLSRIDGLSQANVTVLMSSISHWMSTKGGPPKQTQPGDQSSRTIRRRGSSSSREKS